MQCFEEMQRNESLLQTLSQFENGPKRVVHFSANHNFQPKVIQKRKLSSEMSDCRVRLPFWA